MPLIAEACGYKKVYSCSKRHDFIKYVDAIKEIKGPVLLEVKVRKGARKDLGRPTRTPIENKNEFMDFLS